MILSVKPQRKWLLVRMDRIGDLVLSLPVDQALSDPPVGRPGIATETTWWISPGLRFVTDSALPPRKVRQLNQKIRIGDFLLLLLYLRREKFDAALVFHGPWWVSCLLWLARIPFRAGVKSQWHSFIFLNRAVRQKRSQAEHSELEYNFQLLEAALHLKIGSLPRTSLRLASLASADQRSALLEKYGLKEQDYIVVHPGMGGSALNWPIENYADLIKTMSANCKIAITGTAGDEAYLSPLRMMLEGVKNISWLDRKLEAKELITILQAASKILAPSTGVLHLAASTGRPTLGLFSPVRVQQPKRWGPHGERAQVLMPVVKCPGELRCLGSVCPHYDCMTQIRVEDVIKTLNEL